MLIGYKLLCLIAIGVLFNGVITFGFPQKKNFRKARSGAVVTNGHECAQIGGEVLAEGGTAVDAAIAALFCEGIAQPQGMGIGGGFLMTIYNKETGKVEALNAREAAPSGASENMFNGDPKLSSKGGLSVAVPGEVKGYWWAHQKYGKLPWRRLVEPSVELAKLGHLVTPFLARNFQTEKKQISESPTLREVFINPETNEPWIEGHLLKREQLGKTLQLIADHGPDVLYDGELTAQFLKDIESEGGIITADDLKNYEPQWMDPIVADLPNDQTLYTMPLPGSGVILTFIINILSNFLDLSELNTVTNWQRIVESFKYGYAKRTELGDPGFVPGMAELIANLTSADYAAGIRDLITDDSTFEDPKHYGANFSNVEDHGTAHLSVLAPNGDAVAVTSTINLYYGAGFISRSTGILLNDEMDDFSAPNITNGFGLPPSPANFIVPQKRPLSSMVPSVIVDKNGDVRLVIGAAGGSKITTTSALVAIRKLWYNEDLKSAVRSSRLHHQLLPMRVAHERDFDKEILCRLYNIGHDLQRPGKVEGFAALTAIAANNGGDVEASFDHRRGGSVYIVQ